MAHPRPEAVEGACRWSDPDRIAPSTCRSNSCQGAQERERGRESCLFDVQSRARRDSPPEVFLNAWASALLRKEYHTTLIERLRLKLPAVLRSLRRQRRAVGEEAPEASRIWGPAVRWVERCSNVGLVVLLLLGLGLPGSLFVWAIYMGAEHGDDACPKDLDGLLTWRPDENSATTRVELRFGVLGLAFLFVGCASRRLFCPSNPRC